MAAHSRLSASSSSRWILCPGSIAYIEFLRNEKKIPEETTNKAAQLGTALHEVLEYCIEWEISPLKLSNAKIKKLIDVEVNNYDLGGVDLYWKFIDKLRPEYKKTIAEKKYDLTHRFNEDLGGTADVTQLKRTRLHIGDYKNGRGLVDVVMNTQLLIYALGAYVKFNDKYKFKRVLMSIGQPNAQHPDGRIRTHEIKVSELLKWEDQYLRPAVEKIKRNTSELNPGEKQCEWCPARNHCEANAKQTMQIAQLSFDKYPEPRQDFPQVQELTQQQIAFILDNETRLINFVKSVKEYATERVKEGDQIGDYGVQTKLSNRKFIDENEFRKVLKKYRLTFKSLQVQQDPKPMTITALEKHLGSVKKWDKEKVKKFMKEITTQEVTGVTLVKGAAPEKEFKNLEETKTFRKPKTKRTKKFRRK